MNTVECGISVVVSLHSSFGKLAQLGQKSGGKSNPLCFVLSSSSVSQTTLRKSLQ